MVRKGKYTQALNNTLFKDNFKQNELITPKPVYN